MRHICASSFFLVLLLTFSSVRSEGAKSPALPVDFIRRAVPYPDSAAIDDLLWKGKEKEAIEKIIDARPGHILLAPHKNGNHLLWEARGVAKKMFGVRIYYGELNFVRTNCWPGLSRRTRMQNGQSYRLCEIDHSYTTRFAEEIAEKKYATTDQLFYFVFFRRLHEVFISSFTYHSLGFEYASRDPILRRSPCEVLTTLREALDKVVDLDGGPLKEFKAGQAYELIKEWATGNAIASWPWSTDPHLVWQRLTLIRRAWIWVLSQVAENFFHSGCTEVETPPDLLGMKDVKAHVAYMYAPKKIGMLLEMLRMGVDQAIHHAHVLHAALLQQLSGQDGPWTGVATGVIPRLISEVMGDRMRQLNFLLSTAYQGDDRTRVAAAVSCLPPPKKTQSSTGGTRYRQMIDAQWQRLTGYPPKEPESRRLEERGERWENTDQEIDEAMVEEEG